MLKEQLRSAKEYCRQRLSDFCRRRDPLELFVLLVCVSLAAFLLRCLIVGDTAFFSTFHKNCTDLFMDLWCSLRDAAQGPAVYTERGVQYPPMANLLLFIAARLFPREFLDSECDAAATRAMLAGYPGAMLATFLLIGGSLVFLALVLSREPYSATKKRWLVFAVVFSFPVIFLCERGNTVMLALLAMLLYMQSYDSESSVVRELGLVALAFAASIKLYPALWGAVLLTDKRYKDAVRCACYFLLMLLIPSFFFGGPISVFLSARGVVSYSGNSGTQYYDFLVRWHIPTLLGDIAKNGFYAFAVLFYGVTSFLPRKRYVTWSFAAAFCLTFSSIFSAYNWVLMLPALLTFFREEKLRGVNILYFAAMVLPFCLYIPKVWQDNIIIGDLAVILTVATVESVLLAVAFFKARKAAPKQGNR